MTVNPSGWRPTTPAKPANEPGEAQTVTGNRALMLEEPLLFEIGTTEQTGVDFDSFGLPPRGQAARSADGGSGGQSPSAGLADTSPKEEGSRLGGLERFCPIGLAGLSEPEAVRHYTRLSRQNYAIDLGLFPLGSCTMKHNPRLNEKVARLPGFADIHPLQPADTVQGAFELIDLVATWLIELTGMYSVAMSPKAGAHGELCGILCIRAALEARGDPREVVLVPESAHGTNPATAAFAGYRVENIPANEAGRVDLEALKARLGPDVAGVMITNPNTCGLFEPDMIAISEEVHAAGGFVYCDGANFNAIVGKVRPGDLGIDAMHINLHKTFSTPHGGGGPGSGPVVLSKALAPFAPLPFVERQGERFVLVEEESAEDHHAQSFGRMVAFHGQMGMFTRAASYMLSHGSDGLRQVAEDSVLNANYVLRRLADVLDAPFADSGPCMHEAIFSDRGFGEGLTTLDLAKALIDEGFHPMTMYFPLVVHGAMLIEPTETESKASLDQFITAMRSLAGRARAGDPSLKASPVHAPRRRLDETLAARKPVLVYRDPAPAEAAE
ncbi:MAG TPA: aminomethyl-transferring glycine dehydrogenase subunit GcvPB [Sphingomicrobium sp.]|nr:aminomethyl-transferring glycine dehydrogenase subunit GcvPB [Sphingomicrobium sp.]